jgi:predicted small lipoprotein YifL
MSRRTLLAALGLLPLLAACGRKGSLEKLPSEEEKKRKQNAQ